MRTEKKLKVNKGVCRRMTETKSGRKEVYKTDRTKEIRWNE